MKLKVFKILVISFFFSLYSFSQNKISGYISEKLTDINLEGVSVYDIDIGLITKTNSLGYYELITGKSTITLVFIFEGYQYVE